MLAIVRNARKDTLPRYSAETGRNEPTLVVIVDVDFVLDDTGKVHHSQTYSHLPGEVDAGYYQRQADVLQADLDGARAASEIAAISREQEELADRQINLLLKTPPAKQISVGDKVALNDRSQHDRA